MTIWIRFPAGSQKKCVEQPLVVSLANENFKLNPILIDELYEIVYIESTRRIKIYTSKGGSEP